MGILRGTCGPCLSPGLCALDRRGCRENPAEIAFVDALDRQHHDGRGIIRVRRLDAGPHRFGERRPGLHDHHGFLGAFDRALPPVDRDHAGQDVDAGGEAGAHQRVTGFLSLDNRRKGCVHEHRAFHAASLFTLFLQRKKPALMSQRRDRIAFVTGAIPEADTARDVLVRRYGDAPPADADVIVALGGDGLMLQTLHKFMESGKPIYGMNRGTVGFMMNEYGEDALKERLAAAEESVIHPLAMRAVDGGGKIHTARAINEVSLFRQTNQAARLRILVDGKERLAQLDGDGIMVATPAGSTAYNLSAQGPIIPIGAALLALTPISPFRPRRWRGALLPDTAVVTIEVLAPDKRPVAAVADHHEVGFVRTVEIRMEHKVSMRMLFDPGHNLDERILREQFGV